MAYLVRITEWKTGGREFLVFCNELPAILAESISQAEPTSLHVLANGFGHSLGIPSEPLPALDHSSNQPL